MKITHLTSELFEYEREPQWNGAHFYGNAKIHKVTVYTDEGLIGTGWNGGTASDRPQHLFPGYVDYFRPFLIGRDPMDTEGVVKALGTDLIKILGPAGINTQVLAAINIACWDIKGQALGKSIHQLLGGATPRIRTYIAGGYYQEGKGIPELVEEVQYNVHEMNATAVKIKIGDPVSGFEGDMERVEAARKAIGDDIDLMVDANCALDVDAAIKFAKALEQYNVFWFEEPLPIFDYDGHEKLAKETTVSIATGENGYNVPHFKNLLDQNGASFINVDATICPGYDVAADISNLAKERGAKIAPHGCQEIQIHLAAGMENHSVLESYPVEVDPLRAEIFQPLMKPDKDGLVTVPTTPGLGYSLNMDLLERYRV